MTQRARIAFVVQRYGLEVCGGAELHCRLVAEHLAPYFEVHVLTSTALSYLPWDNYYAPGESTLNGVIVHRFTVDEKRDHLFFDNLTRKVFGEHHTYFDELEWLRHVGPHCLGLLDHIKQERDRYAAFVFFTYQYSHTYFGLQLVPEKSILVPTAHDDRTLYLSAYRPLFHLPRVIAYNTYPERSLVEWLFDNAHVPNQVVGTGIEVPSQADPQRFRRKFGLEGDLIVYLGRIEEAKGCPQLFHYFTRYRDEVRRPATLVLMGRSEMSIPNRPDIVPLGFVSDQDKADGLAAASLLVAPSPHESLSMTCLEAWQSGLPVLVNAQCEVLKDNCLRSNGGLYYSTYEEFATCLEVLLGDPSLRCQLGTAGRAYAEANYSWDVIVRKYLEMIALVVGAEPAPSSNASQEGTKT